MDAGDVYFAAPAISQLLMGESTIDIYNMMGYDAGGLWQPRIRQRPG